ncbi:hypothetical protein PEC311524_07030 [Pectobacterium carotovorum subsp. carotovorum]|nr:hypothetical protein PEC311524_07030 [Pectobacterium carotovorum subsp. carotovorum]
MTQVVYGNSVEPGYTLESEYVDGECDACGKSVSIHYYESCHSGTINQQKSYSCSCGHHFSDDEYDDYDSYDHEKYNELAADMYVEDLLGLHSRTELLVRLADIEGQVMGAKTLFELHCLPLAELQNILKESLFVIKEAKKSSYAVNSSLCAELFQSIRKACKPLLEGCLMH